MICGRPFQCDPGQCPAPPGAACDGSQYLVISHPLCHVDHCVWLPSWIDCGPGGCDASLGRCTQCDPRPAENRCCAYGLYRPYGVVCEVGEREWACTDGTDYFIQNGVCGGQSVMRPERRICDGASATCHQLASPTENPFYPDSRPEAGVCGAPDVLCQPHLGEPTECIQCGPLGCQQDACVDPCDLDPCPADSWSCDLETNELVQTVFACEADPDGIHYACLPHENRLDCSQFPMGTGGWVCDPDATVPTCAECRSAEPCCDASSHFVPAGAQCSTQPIWGLTERRCSPGSPGDSGQVERLDFFPSCTGQSGLCTDASPIPAPFWVPEQTCDATTGPCQQSDTQAACMPCTNPRSPQRAQPHCEQDPATGAWQVVTDNPASGIWVPGTGCTYQPLVLWQCPFGCQDGFCTGDPSAPADGVPCPDENPDRCLVNPRWFAGRCIGQIQSCAVSGCPQTDCPFVSGVEDSEILTVTTQQGSYEIAANRVSITATHGTTPGQMAAFVSGPPLSGEIVAQLPETRTPAPGGYTYDDYVFEVQVSAPTQTDLDQVISQVMAANSPLVLDATYAYIPAEAGDECLTPTPNYTFEVMGPVQQCAYLDTEFPVAYHLFHHLQETGIFQALLPRAAEAKVRVLVVDKGLDMNLVDVPGAPFYPIWSSGHLRYVVQGGSSNPPASPDPHGTKVTSVIAAPGGEGAHMEGLAHVFLKSGLYVMVTTPVDLRKTRGAVHQIMATYGNATDLVNISLEAGAKSLSEDVRAAMNANFSGIVDLFPGTLFVVASPNHYPVEGYLTPYAGLVRPNLLAVQGTALCHPELLAGPTKYWDTQLGGPMPAAHFVAAPSVDIPVMQPDGSVGVASGNSFATPQVTSLAAVLKWIDRASGSAETFDASKIRDYLSLNAPFGAPSRFAASETAAGGQVGAYPVIDFYAAIMGTLLDRAEHSPVQDLVEILLQCRDRLVDPSAHCIVDGLDNPSIAMGRSCGGTFNLQVDNVQPIYYSTWDEDPRTETGGGLAINSGGWLLSVSPASGPVVTVGGMDSTIELDVDYALDPNEGRGLAIASRDGEPIAGSLEDASIRFTSCQINERGPQGNPWMPWPGMNKPMGGLMRGRISGTLTHYLPEGGFESVTIQRGEFYLPWTTIHPEQMEYMECLCYGGSEAAASTCAGP